MDVPLTHFTSPLANNSPNKPSEIESAFPVHRKPHKELTILELHPLGWTLRILGLYWGTQSNAIRILSWCCCVVVFLIGSFFWRLCETFCLCPVSYPAIGWITATAFHIAGANCPLVYGWSEMCMGALQRGVPITALSVGCCIPVDLILPLPPL